MNACMDPGEEGGVRARVRGGAGVEIKVHNLSRPLLARLGPGSTRPGLGEVGIGVGVRYVINQHCDSWRGAMPLTLSQ